MQDLNTTQERLRPFKPYVNYEGSFVALIVTFALGYYVKTRVLKLQHK